MIQQMIYKGTARGYKTVAASEGLLVNSALLHRLEKLCVAPSGAWAKQDTPCPVYSRCEMNGGVALALTVKDVNDDRNRCLTHMLYISGADLEAYKNGMVNPGLLRSIYNEAQEGDRLRELDPREVIMPPIPSQKLQQAAKYFFSDVQQLAAFLHILQLCARPVSERGFSGVCVNLEKLESNQSQAIHVLMEGLLRVYKNTASTEVGYRSMWNAPENNVQYPIFFTDPRHYGQTENLGTLRYVLMDLEKNLINTPRQLNLEPNKADVGLAKALLEGEASQLDAAIVYARDFEELERKRIAEEKRRRAEAERRRREEEERKRREEEERRRAEEERKRREEEERRRAEEERKRREEEERRRAERERKAREEAARRAEEERKAREEAERLAEEERKRKEEIARRAEEKRKAREEAERLAEEERKQKEEKARRAEEKRLRQEEIDRQNREEAERKAQEENERRAEKRRRAMEEKRKAQEEEKRKAEEERKAREEEKRKAEEERKAREEEKRKAEEERKAREEEKRKAEEERKAREEEKRKAEEERKAQEEKRRAQQQRDRELAARWDNPQPVKSANSIPENKQQYRPAAYTTGRNTYSKLLEEYWNHVRPMAILKIKNTGGRQLKQAVESWLRRKAPGWSASEYISLDYPIDLMEALIDEIERSQDYDNPSPTYVALVRSAYAVADEAFEAVLTYSTDEEWKDFTDLMRRLQRHVAYAGSTGTLWRKWEILLSILQSEAKLPQMKRAHNHLIALREDTSDKWFDGFRDMLEGCTHGLAEEMGRFAVRNPQRETLALCATLTQFYAKVPVVKGSSISYPKRGMLPAELKKSLKKSDALELYEDFLDRLEAEFKRSR